ncbi:MAG: glycoside hydrolase family 43 protein [Nocardioides sp.]
MPHPRPSAAFRRAFTPVGAAILCATLAAGCAAEGTGSTAGLPQPTTTPSPAAIVPGKVFKTLPPDPVDQAERVLGALARQAEARALAQPPQARPEPIDVVGETDSWRAGAAYNGIFADPDIVRHDGRWLAYATNTSHYRLPTLTSDDLTTWRPITDGDGRTFDPLPEVGDWVQGNNGGSGLWAPAVAKIGDGWTAAYSAQISTVAGQRHNCIGLARAEQPGGPFQHLGPPAVCAPESRLGVIDPDLYVDALGIPWMLWKFSGVHNSRPAAVFSRQLNPDGTGWAEGSETYEILTHQGGWEGNTIENPSMVTFRGVTYLFYSGNAYTTDAYATGYAICAGPAGPCTRPSSAPLLDNATTGHLGPGGATAFVQGDSLRLAYHAWEPGQVNRLRRLHIAGLWQREDSTLELENAG